MCSGLGHYFGIDAVWPRLIFALLTIGYGGGLIIYIVLWIVLPVEALEEEAGVKKTIAVLAPGGGTIWAGGKRCFKLCNRHALR